MNKLKRFPELLGGSDSPTLDQVLERGRQLYRLSALVKEKLGPEFAPHTQVGNIRGNTLVLFVASTAWATRLRYQVPELLKHFAADQKLNRIREIKIRITPESSPRSASQGRRATMSQNAAYCIQQCAETVDDEKLSGALNRLANRQKRKP